MLDPYVNTTCPCGLFSVKLLYLIKTDHYRLCKCKISSPCFSKHFVRPVPRHHRPCIIKIHSIGLSLCVPSPCLHFPLGIITFCGWNDPISKDYQRVVRRERVAANESLFSLSNSQDRMHDEHRAQFTAGARARTATKEMVMQSVWACTWVYMDNTRSHVGVSGECKT